MEAVFALLAGFFATAFLAAAAFFVVRLVEDFFEADFLAVPAFLLVPAFLPVAAFFRVGAFFEEAGFFLAFEADFFFAAGLAAAFLLTVFFFFLETAFLAGMVVSASSTD